MARADRFLFEMSRSVWYITGDCTQDFLEAAVIVIENGLSGTAGECARLWASIIPCVCQKPVNVTNISVHDTNFIDKKHSLCIRACALTTSRNLPLLPKFVHKKECRYKCLM